MSDVEERRRRRSELRNRYAGIYERLSHILFTEDPIGINFGTNPDEYEPEVDTILPRLRNYHEIDDVRRIVHEEFVSWFDEDTAGHSGRYTAIARRICEEILPELAAWRG